MENFKYSADSYNFNLLENLSLDELSMLLVLLSSKGYHFFSEEKDVINRVIYWENVGREELLNIVWKTWREDLLRVLDYLDIKVLDDEESEVIKDEEVEKCLLNISNRSSKKSTLELLDEEIENLELIIFKFKEWNLDIENLKAVNRSLRLVKLARNLYNEKNESTDNSISRFKDFFRALVNNEIEKNPSEVKI